MLNKLLKDNANNHEATKILLYRRMLRTSWAGHVSNDDDVEKNATKDSYKHQLEAIEIFRLHNAERRFGKVILAEQSQDQRNGRKQPVT